MNDDDDDEPDTWQWPMDIDAEEDFSNQDEENSYNRRNVMTEYKSLRNICLQKNVKFRTGGTTDDHTISSTVVSWCFIVRFAYKYVLVRYFVYFIL